jgi:hypothetical protein
MLEETPDEEFKVYMTRKTQGWFGPFGAGSSIYMWVYGVEICFSPSASKNLNSVHPHIVSKGRGHAFNV